MTTSISGTSGITFPNGSNQDVGALGVGQTWQNMTASRAYATTYTNNTGKPIQVVISTGGASASGVALQATIGGVGPFTFAQCALPSGNAIVAGSFVVPNGSTYSVNASGGPNVNSWYELR